MSTEHVEVETHELFGLLAEFEEGEALVEATNQAYEAGYRQLDAYTPFPVHGLSEALRLDRQRNWVPYLVLFFGAILLMGLPMFRLDRRLWLVTVATTVLLLVSMGVAMRAGVG